MHIPVTEIWDESYAKNMPPSTVNKLVDPVNVQPREYWPGAVKDGDTTIKCHEPPEAISLPASTEMLF